MHNSTNFVISCSNEKSADDGEQSPECVRPAPISLTVFCQTRVYWTSPTENRVHGAAEFELGTRDLHGWG